MGYPELDLDESIILEAQNVKYKSISFDARLTNRRIILIDNKKNIIPPHEILLATIWNVEAGENAIRDHLLSLTVINNAGEKDQIVLTFPRLAGTERKRECGDWAKKLQGLIRSPDENVIPDQDESSKELFEKHEPSPSPVREERSAGRPLKKKIEIARPLNKIVEPVPKSVKPVETSSLPSGIFCTRCGNRVPPESTFCNHCGTPIKQPSGAASKPTADIPQVQIPVPPQVASAGEHQDRPIEQIIHSIEPLIEDSVPRSLPTPLVKKRAPQIVSETILPELPDETITAESPAGSVVSEFPENLNPPVKWPVLQTTDSPLAPSIELSSASPESPPPVPPSAPASKTPRSLAIAALVIIILAVIAGLIIASNLAPGQAPGGSTATTPATTVTTAATPRPTIIQTTAITTTIIPTPTQVIIPSEGVWVRVTYRGNYTGMVGTPGDQTEVTDSGEHIYRISTNNGTVAVSLQKLDGSADKILVEIYKNGVKVKDSSTVTPKGIVEIQFDLKSLQ